MTRRYLRAVLRAAALLWAAWVGWGAALCAQAGGEVGNLPRACSEFPPVRPALRRAVEVVSLAAEVGGANSRMLRHLAFELARGLEDPLERLELLERLRSTVPAEDRVSRSYVDYCLALPMRMAGDHARYVAQLHRCVETGEERDRISALEELVVWASNNGKASDALAWLRQLEQIETDRFRVGLRRAGVYLAFGMHRAAAIEIDRIEVLAADAERRAAVAALRLEELSVGEQFEEFLEQVQTVRDADAVGIRHQRAFALSRTGQLAAAEAELVALLKLWCFDPERLPLLQADLAMVRRGLGVTVDGVAECLGRAADGDPTGLHDRVLAARARLDLDRWRLGRLHRTELLSLRQALRQRLSEMQEHWRAMPEQSAGVAFMQWSPRRELLVCLCLAEWEIDGPAAFTTGIGYALATDACGSMARRRGHSPLAPEAFLQAAVPPNGALCWFLPAPHGSVVMVASATERQLIELPGDIPMRGWLTRLRAMFRDEHQLGKDWRDGAAAVTQPVEAWLFQGQLLSVFRRYRRITILGRELLAGLPFEFLRSPCGPEVWFGHSHAIDYVPAASLLGSPRSSRHGAGARRPLHLAAVCDTASARNARYGDLRLPIAECELQDLAAQAGVVAAAIDTAVDRAVLTAAAATSECLVVFAHGRRRDLSEAPAAGLGRHLPVGIVLSDGFFGAEQVECLSDLPSCVVLASCGAARAGVDRGEDGQLFTTAWLAAGCECVICAEGDLQVTAAVRQIGHLLREMSMGTDPAEALRRSRLAIVRESQSSHPALHCSLRLDRAGPCVPLPLLAGAGRGQVEGAGSHAARWCALLAALLAAGGVLVLHRYWRRAGSRS